MLERTASEELAIAKPPALVLRRLSYCVLVALTIAGMIWLAVTALKRSPLLPAVPTIDESGYPGYDIVNWFGFLAPAGTPADIIRRLNSVITKVAGSSEIKSRLALQGAEPLTATPEEMRAFLSAEITKWDKVVRATGARVD